MRRPEDHRLLRRATFGFALLGAVATPGLMAQQKVPLVLHHLIVRLDSATYHDVSISPFMREQFAPTQSPVAIGPDGGPLIRMFGKYNFLQVAPGRPGANSLAGDVGIVLASEHPGGLEQLGAEAPFELLLEKGPVTVDDAPSPYQYFEFSDRLRPAGSDATSDRVEFQLMQYSGVAVRDQFRIDSLPATNLSTARFLARFYDPRKLLLRLTAATLAMSVDDIARIVRVLKRNGTTVYAEGEGAIIKLDGFSLHLIPPWNGPGVKQLQFAVTRDVPANPVYRFGPRSRLRFGPGAIAVWDFTTP